MSLQDRLDKVRKEFEASAPSDALAIMHRATEDLRNSGVLDRALKTGDRAPEFTLPDVQGHTVSSSALLQRGPLVVSFYRGVW